MKSALLVCLTCLILVNAQGRISGSSEKCRCSDGYIGRINRKALKSEPEIHRPSVFCTKTEIILSIGTEKRCVDPQSPLGKLILGKKKQQDKKQAALRTTTSSLNHTGSSTTFHSTSSAPTLSAA